MEKPFQPNTTPGIHKLFVMSSFRQDEQLILNKLSKEFYLTHSGEEFTLGQSSRYRYFLLKPTSVFSEMFNIDREIIAIFSDYENFEPRTLDAFDFASSKLPDLRVENVCRFLISRDKNIEEKITNLLKTDPERPIIIPFTYQELSQSYDDYFIRNRFRKDFYSRDLFSFLSPLRKDLYFFGRSDLIQNLVNRHRAQEHSGLFGLRKSGKTSIIYAIERFTASHSENVITIDCESPSIHKRRWNELLFHLVDQYKSKQYSKVRISSEHRYDEKRASETFEKDMLNIYRSMPVPTLFIFDEIERISPITGSSEHWRNGEDFVYFWQSMRAFYQQHPEVFTYLLVGTNPYCIETPTIGIHDNPIFGSIPFQYVPSFDVAKTREMVRKLGRFMGLKFDEMIYSKLTEDFGGHPFLIRQVCSIINSMAIGNRPIKVDKGIYEKAKASFLLDSKHYLEMIMKVLKEWYPDEYDMLILLANNDQQLFEDMAQDNNYYTNHLIGYGLINYSTNGYYFNIEAVKDYLQKQHKFEKITLSDEEKSTEISQRRNAIEKKLRVVIRNQLKGQYGKSEAIKKLVASLRENRRDKIVNDIDLLFDPASCPLYFTDLINIIEHEWAIFKNIFEMDKPRLIFYLNEINIGRGTDAHSKTISNEDFEQLRICFKKIEDILDNW